MAISKATDSPSVLDVHVIPVAGHDSMLLRASGPHSPYSTRTLVLLRDSTGRVGIGEIPYSRWILRALHMVTVLVGGTEIDRYNRTLGVVRESLGCAQAARGGLASAAQVREADLHMENVITAIEAALLDLLGQYLGMPACELLGSGRQRAFVPLLASLHFIGDCRFSGLPYCRDAGTTGWYRLRHEEALSSLAIVELAAASADRYGFRDFKLKGGAMHPDRETAAALAIKRLFPHARVALAPDGAWPLAQATDACRRASGMLAYVEDPCRGEHGRAGGDVMADFKHATGIPTATGLTSADWQHMAHSYLPGTVEMCVVDPHAWTMQEAVRFAQLCRDWRLTWSLSADRHFDVSLAMSVHAAASAPGNVAAVDTPRIWQEGRERLTREPLQIVGGQIMVPDRPGLGVEPDMDRIMMAHELYERVARHADDDWASMPQAVAGTGLRP
jgi:glucarate dehydratase